MLIAKLAAQTRVQSRHLAKQWLAAGAGVGCLMALAMILGRLGLRADLATAPASASFWAKAAYTSALACFAGRAALRLAQPDTVPGWWLAWLALPVLVLSVATGNIVALAPADTVTDLWMGQTARSCPLLIVLLAVPVFGGMIWALRRLAPVHLRLAGAAAGLAAGALAATVYGLHCPESSMAFLLAWYTLGIGLSGAIGAALGPWLLRW